MITKESSIRAQELQDKRTNYYKSITGTFQLVTIFIVAVVLSLGIFSIGVQVGYSVAVQDYSVSQNSQLSEGE